MRKIISFIQNRNKLFTNRIVKNYIDSPVKENMHIFLWVQEGGEINEGMPGSR